MKKVLTRLGLRLDSPLTIAVIGIAGLGLMVAALAFAVDAGDLGRAFRAMAGDPVGLTISITAFFVAFLLRSMAWRRLVPTLSLGHSLAGIHLALGANHVLPLRLGEPFRVASVVRRTNVSFDAAASSTVLLRTADIATVLGIGWLLAPTVFMRLVGPWVFGAAVALFAVALAAGWWWRKAANATTTVRFPGPTAFALTAAAWLFEAVVTWHAASWAGLEISAGDALLITAVAVAAQVIAFTPSGLGIYEAAAVAAYVALGHDAEVALVAALTAHAVKTTYSLFAGGVAVVVPAPSLVGRLRLPKARPPRSIPPDPSSGPATTPPPSNEVVTTAAPNTAPRPVVLFMPALNEQDSVGQCIGRVPASVLGHPVHTLIIDDGSSDQTAEIAAAAGAEVVSFPSTQGLGAGVRFGLGHALTYDPVAVAFCDADEEYPPEELANLVAPILANEADYVVGSRFLGQIEHMRPHRRFGNKVLTRCVAFLSRTKVTDGQSGYRAFSPAAARDAEVIHDFNYAQVITLDLLAKGYRYAEVGITYRFRTAGDSFIKLGPYLRRVIPAIYRELNTTS